MSLFFYIIINPLPNDKISDLSKIKVAHENSKRFWVKQVSYLVESTVGKKKMLTKALFLWSRYFHD